MKIAFCGPSGSGKTTLATYAANEHGIEFISNSASHLMSKEDQDMLAMRYAYQPSGHKAVIRKSHVNPEFGKDFQKALLRERAKLYLSDKAFIADRCPIDNLAYFIDQCIIYADPTDIMEFLMLSAEAFSKTDLLFRVKVVNPSVEDNGSRVANLVYQKKMDLVFSLAQEMMEVYCKENKLKIPTIITIDFWDLTSRKNLVNSQIEYHKNLKTLWPD